MPIQYHFPAKFSISAKNQTAYPIEREIHSPATHIIFTHNEAQQPLCLKLWKVCHNDLYEIEDPADCTAYHLEGLPFNRRFAPGIYLGLAPVRGKNAEEILCDRIIRRPAVQQLEVGVEYALVMKRIDSTWSLDYQLDQRGLGTRTGMEFLAREVARMHRKLKRSAKDKGTSESIAKKLTFNKDRFVDALQKLASQHIDTYIYSRISESIDQAYIRCEPLFRQRHINHAIKRCHGDLKVPNLWVRPESGRLGGLVSSSACLLALDCIDFNADFCHIDTLSDVAMLAIDLEMHLSNQQNLRADAYRARNLTTHFLQTYLNETGENSIMSWDLLKYYMLEKAIVCTYMCILYDTHVNNIENLTHCLKYLELFLAHVIV